MNNSTMERMIEYIEPEYYELHQAEITEREELSSKLFVNPYSEMKNFLIGNHDRESFFQYLKLPYQNLIASSKGIDIITSVIGIVVFFLITYFYIDGTVGLYKDGIKENFYLSTLSMVLWFLGTTILILFFSLKLSYDEESLVWIFNKDDFIPLWGKIFFILKNGLIIVIFLSLLNVYLGSVQKEVLFLITPLSTMVLTIFILDHIRKRKISERINKLKFRIEGRENEGRMRLERNDEITSETNDAYNVNFEKEHTYHFVRFWHKYQHNELNIQTSIDEINKETYEKTKITKSLKLVETCESVLEAVFLQWYRNNYSDISLEKVKQDFLKIKEEAKERAGGTAEKFSILESYLYYLTYSMFDLISHCSNEVKARSGINLELHENAYEVMDLMTRRKIDDNILNRKIYFFLLTVLYLDTSELTIVGRNKAEKDTNIAESIEELEDEIGDKKSINRGLELACEKNRELKKWLEEEVEKIKFSDSNYIEKCNQLIEESRKRIQS